MYDIAIVGGGVTGLYLANLLENKNVILFEEHKNLGPRRCSGIVSRRIEKLIDLPKYLVEKEVEYAILRCGKTYSEIKINSLVLDKERLEDFLLRKARKKVEVKFEKVNEIIESHENVIIKTEQNKYKSKYIVGCDGPNSVVRRTFLNSLPKNFYFGKFCYSREKSTDCHEIFFDSKYSDLFAWIAPRRNKVEYGVICERNLSNYYNNFLKDRKPKIIEEGFGVVPIDFFKYSFSKGILIGNACAQVKPLTGGGIIYGLIASKIAAEEFEKEKPNFFEYERRCKSIFEKEIKLQLLFRKFYSKLSDRKKEKLLKAFAKEHSKIDMDFPMKYILKNKKKIDILRLIISGLISFR